MTPGGRPVPGRLRPLASLACIGLGWAAAAPAQAQLVISETLTGEASGYAWTALNGACLTARPAGSTVFSKIPACQGLPYYGSAKLVGGANGVVPDPLGSGALRLTNGDVKTGGTNGDNQTGAVVSEFTFPSQQGLEVTFTTVTYGGDGLRDTGADGIGFYLMDGSKGPAVGALGGSLGYACSNVNSTYDGVPGGYVGVGIDEYGNFTNPATTTATGPGFLPGRISLRGAGDINWASLTARFPTFYPSTLGASDQRLAVQQTCTTGLVQNFSGRKMNVDGVDVAYRASTGRSAGLNYALMVSSALPSQVSIANQHGVAKPKRADAMPITYALKITQNGLLSLAYSVNGGIPQPMLTDQSIITGNGTLPASFRFGFAGATGSGSNVHEITCFKATTLEQSQSSAGTNVPQSARVEAGTQLYLASYHPVNWWGELTAQTLLLDPLTDTVSINPVANWNAHCVLTGGACPSTGQATVAQGPSQRRMLTWDGSRGVPFQWTALTAAQRSALTPANVPAADPAASQVLQYLRGERGKEVDRGGPLRTRTGLLGDIMDSGPAWVGAPSSPYAGPWTDALAPQAAAPEAGYADFQRRLAGRQNVVYVGANDGWLHGLRSGAYDAQGRFVADAATPNDGLEVLAYMPAAVLGSVHPASAALDYSSPQYAHAYHVDATPGTGDLYYAGAWHTWLVGGLGPGGQAGGPVGDTTTAAPGSFYALDITDPQRFSEADAASLVIGEWSAATLACINVVSCGQHLGSVSGTPLIRRLHNGQWAVLFGNGLNSTSGNAGLFVMLVNPQSGSTSLRYLDTGYGPSRDPLAGGARNGIVQVTAADLDGDHITDYVYGGDVFGNVWRFDLSGGDPVYWRAAGAPLFGTGGAPISSRIVVAAVPDAAGGAARVILGFGTGRRRVQTQTQAAVYAGGDHAVYGVWDWDLVAWNSQAAPAARYASLAAPQTVNRGKLLAQSVLATVPGSGAVSGYRTVSRRKVCWAGTAACPGSSAQFGWVLALPLANEQVIYHPVIAYGMLLVSTTVPEKQQPLTCDSTPPAGFTMALTLGDGGAPAASFFANAANQFVSYDGGFVAGIGLGATGTPTIVSANRRPFMASQTVNGAGGVAPINPLPGGSGGRLTWMELR